MLSLVVAIVFSFCALAQTRVPKDFEVWRAPIEKRISAGSFSRNPTNRTIQLAGCRNEYLSAQLACRNNKDSELSYQTSTLREPAGAEIPADQF